MTKTAMIVVDVQYDFCEGGSLAVTGGNRVAADIAKYLEDNTYDLVVFTQDWHIDPGNHWSQTPDYVDTWPVHCEAGTHGAQIHQDLREIMESGGVISVHKGMYDAAYSGFEAVVAENPTATLQELLNANEITAIDVVGLALDHCVKATAIDGAAAGFTTRVLTAMSAAVTPENTENVLDGLRAGGVTIV